MRVHLVIVKCWNEMTTPAQRSLSWVDDFLLYDAVVVAGLTFLDWLLGPAQRAVMKRRVAVWWRFVRRAKYGGLVAKDARLVRLWLQRIFGARILSARFFFTALGASLLLMTISYYGVGFLEGARVGKGYTINFVAYAIPNMPLDWISLAVTIHLLKIMERYPHFWSIAAIALLDLVLALALGILTFVLFSFTFDLITLRPLPPINALVMKTVVEMSYYLPVYLEGIITPGQIALTGYVVIFTSALPTLIHFGLAVLLLGSKLVRPILQRPTAILLQRLSESDKGVLTQVAVGLGVLTKLAQEGLKRFGT